MSATDRELLELAARAAGLRVKYEEAHGCYWIELGQGIPIDVWNPLDHDGDALRLVAKLHIEISHNHPADQQCYVAADIRGCECVNAPVCCIEDEFEEKDRAAAMRRAIVRAAAAIAAAQQTQGGE